MPEYHIWWNMRYRCYNPKHKAFYAYGGRGIRVCEQWLKSFDAFLSDIGPRPSHRHSIDRINNDGHYEPGNVRWATAREQLRNKRSNRLIHYSGRTMPMIEWATEYGLNRSTLARRLNCGWSIERALTTRARLGSGASNGRWSRDQRGELNSRAVLTEDDVRAIRNEYAALNGRRGTVKALSNKYGVLGTTIHMIVARHLWKHVA